MKFIFRNLFFLILFPLSIQSHMVRVLLSEDLAQDWIISAPRGVMLQDKKTDKVVSADLTSYKITIEKNKDGILVNKKKAPSKSFWIQPYYGHLSFNGNAYDGSFLVIKEKNKWKLINELDIEEYIYSVLKTESWPGWPLETQKVLAIACRSYLLHQLLDANQKKSCFHIRSTNRHQTYQGIHKNEVIRQAIEETKGIFVSHNKYPILAMFDSCCGGVIPSKTVGLVDFNKAPYLARSYACTYCENTKFFEWSTTCSVENLASIVKEARNCMVHPICDVKIAKRDDGGLVQHVSVKTKKEKFTLKVRELYGSVKGIKSYCFSLFKKGKNITIEGKGRGHHMGLCQWGACEMVRLGWNYEDILEFYYPETKLMKLVGTT